MTLASSGDLWQDHVRAWLTRDMFRTELTEDEMSQLNNANVVLSGLHVLEAFADMVVYKHEKGEHVTYGDVAQTIASQAPAAVAAAGIADHPWRPAPKKRGGGRRPAAAAADPEGNGQ